MFKIKKCLINGSKSLNFSCLYLPILHFSCLLAYPLPILAYFGIFSELFCLFRLFWHFLAFFAYFDIFRELFLGNVLAQIKFFPIASCDVERSFSDYKSILTDKRTSFTPENLEMYVIC